MEGLGFVFGLLAVFFLVWAHLKSSWVFVAIFCDFDLILREAENQAHPGEPFFKA